MERGPAQVLIVDDDDDLRDALSVALSDEGYSVLTAVDGIDALRVVDECVAENLPIDTMLVDLLMPQLDGLSLCRQLRASGHVTPILLLTALDEVGDRVAGLDAGADDYLPKPFSLAELLARVRALLRRVRIDDGDAPLVVGDLRLEPISRSAARDGMALALTSTEFDLLRLLMSHAGQLLSRERIYAEIWGPGVPVTSRSLDVYVSYLRNKTEAGGRARLVETVRGHGFTIRASP